MVAAAVAAAAVGPVAVGELADCKSAVEKKTLAMSLNMERDWLQSTAGQTLEDVAADWAAAAAAVASHEAVADGMEGSDEDESAADAVGAAAVVGVPEVEEAVAVVDKDCQGIVEPLAEEKPFVVVVVAAVVAAAAYRLLR